MGEWMQIEWRVLQPRSDRNGQQVTRHPEKGTAQTLSPTPQEEPVALALKRGFWPPAPWDKKFCCLSRIRYGNFEKLRHPPDAGSQKFLLLSVLGHEWSGLSWSSSGITLWGQRPAPGTPCLDDGPVRWGGYQKEAPSPSASPWNCSKSWDIKKMILSFLPIM